MCIPCSQIRVFPNFVLSAEVKRILQDLSTDELKMGDAQHIDIITRALKSLENRASTINSAHMWFHAVSNIKYYLVKIYLKWLAH